MDGYTNIGHKNYTSEVFFDSKSKEKETSGNLHIKGSIMTWSKKIIKGSKIYTQKTSDGEAKSMENLKEKTHQMTVDASKFQTQLKKMDTLFHCLENSNSSDLLSNSKRS